jgi:hypothetical protein
MAWTVVKRVLLVLGVVVVLAAGVAVAQIGPRNLVGILRYDQRRAGELRVGDRAPDPTLVALDGKSAVHLLGQRGPRPLVLVFGSFT